MAVLDRRGLENISGISMRNETRTQFISDSADIFLSTMNIPHIRIYLATPKEGTRIESFNSVLEREVINRFEFENFAEEETTIWRVVDFYNS